MVDFGASAHLRKPPKPGRRRQTVIARLDRAIQYTPTAVTELPGHNGAYARLRRAIAGQ